ncbi:Ran GTPase-activating protein 1 [Nosema granulosis]|uniref:Ran GTPase-activating protein 1 n=1 Tax=Nosema granulosis TaxID=83296 RepID=A0A9P6GZ44_9MICR|nr:Ran GTPase-activating protein 1 [Nosema granulosis]
MLYSIRNEEKKYSDKSDVAEIVKDLSLNPHRITELDFTSNVFKPVALAEICKCIEKMDNLTTVIFDEIFTTLVKEDMLKCFKMISKALMGKKIEHLDLSNNALSAELPQEFIDLLMSLDTLKYFNIRNCGLGLLGGDKLGECFLNFKSKHCLEYVDLAQNRFFKFPQVLSQGIKALDNIKTLHLEFNTIEKDTMSDFLGVLADKPIEILDIRDNFLNMEGCKTLGRLFSSLDFKELLIGDCLMHDEGVKMFLKHASTRRISLGLPGDIEACEYCSVLDLSYNDFEQDCVELLVDFCGKYQIGKLLINGNFFDEIDSLKVAMEKYGGLLVTEDEAIEVPNKSDIDDSLVGMVSNL